MKVIKIEKLPKQVTYDIEVEDNHNYCITDKEIVVHNSGKGFVVDKLLSIEAKIFDVDDIKKKIVSPKTIKLNKKIMDTYGIDVTALKLNVPEDVKLLHKINQEMGIAKKDQENFLKSQRNKDRLPNIIFDTTLKNISKLQELVDTVTDAGYQKENIHVVWVVNDVEQAIKQNLSRERIVPHDILVQTHELVSATMARLLNNNEFMKYVQGDIFFVFNKQFVDSTMRFAQDLHKNYGDVEDGQEEFKYLKNKKIKDKRTGSFVEDALILKVKAKGKRPMSFGDIPSMFIDRIKSYVPHNTLKAWGG